MISSRTMLFGVAGDPVSHSLSPILQNYFFKLFGVDGVYLAFHVMPAELPAALLGARAMGLSGLNITIPHKNSAARLSECRSREVDLLGVANTLAIRAGKVHAFTTDHIGFVNSLGSEKERFAGSNVLLFGAGGSARSIAFALSGLGVANLTIANRSHERAADLESFCRTSLHMTAVTAMTFEHPGLWAAIAGSSILINATASGMFPHSDEAPISSFDMISKSHFVYDLVYNPRNTRLMAEAKKRGAAVQGGLEMLVHQGLAALNIWLYADYQLQETELNKLKTLLLRELR
jgi:shikimate dehydrogenase